MLPWGALLLLAPLPFQTGWLWWTDPSLVWPTIWLVSAGLTALWFGVAPLPWAAAAGLGWASWRVWQGGILGRSLEVLVLVGLGAVLYGAATRLPLWSERWLAWLILIPAGGNAGLGLWNLTAPLTPAWRVLDPGTGLPPFWRAFLSQDPYGHPPPWIGPLSFQHPAYPWRAIQESFWGLPHGLFVHPNYWALYLALCLPLVWWALSSRRRVALVTVWGWVVLIATSRSWAATGAAFLVATILSWSAMPRVLSVGVLAILPLGLGVGWLALKGVPFTLGGRWPVWQIGLEWVWGRARWIGEGLGMWRVWALWEQGPIWLGSPRHGFPAQDRMAGWWAEAQGEPVQLLFELGLIGLGIGLWWAGTVAWEGWCVWRTRDGLGRAWVAILVVAGLTSLFTIPFRLPATVGLLLFAAGRVRARSNSSGLGSSAGLLGPRDEPRESHLLAGDGDGGGAPGDPRIRLPRRGDPPRAAPAHWRAGLRRGEAPRRDAGT